MHAQYFCSTWMMSRMQFEKSGGESFRTGIWYFGEGMDNNSTSEKDEIRRDRQNFVQKLCVHTVNGQTNNN